MTSKQSKVSKNNLIIHFLNKIGLIRRFHDERTKKKVSSTKLSNANEKKNANYNSAAISMQQYFRMI